MPIFIYTFCLWTHRSDADSVLPGDIVQAVQPSGVKRSEDAQEQHVPAMKIIPFHSEDKHLDLDAVKHRYRRGCDWETTNVLPIPETVKNTSQLV